MPVVGSRLLEVLAPAGSMEHVHAAIAAGADAIYIGIKGMSARPDPWGFDLSTAIEATGKRIYFALNAEYMVRELIRRRRWRYWTSQMLYTPGQMEGEWHFGGSKMWASFVSIWILILMAFL